MAWVYLFIAGAFEIVWALALKYADGFTKFWPSVLTVAGLTFSIIFLALAAKTLPIGTAYAIWTGIGAVGVAIFGMILLGESREVARLLCIFLIVVGIIGLKCSTK
jgi:quaternary ammonium compound-resistance protein SugE